MRTLIFGIAVLLSACGDPDPEVGDDVDSGAGEPDGPAAVDGAVAQGDAGPVATGGCGKAGARGMQERTPMVSGVTRHYQLFVPSGYDAEVPMQLVFVFHGLGGDGDQIRAYFGFEAEAQGQALFAYPDGLPVQGGTGWSTTDVAFFDAMVDEISADYCVDASRVFATGHSYGGYMSNLLGCARPDVLRGIAPASGGLLTGNCGGPVAAWLVHGDADGTVPQSEGLAARDHWRTVNGCLATSTATGVGDCVRYDGCSDGHPVEWCSFSGGHYPLPGYTQQAIWDFFQGL